MSTFATVGVPLLTVAATLAGGWFVTTRITDHWDQIKKHREMDLAAAEHFQRLYGEFIVVWKTWNALEGKHTAACPAPEEARWDCLQRMIEVEGEVEALVAKLATERVLTETEIDMLGSVRQAFKFVRRTIRKGRPLNWTSDEVEPYAAFKALVAALSHMVMNSPGPQHRPSSAVAARNFLQITDNLHEITWVATGLRLADTPIPEQPARRRRLLLSPRR